MTEDHMELGSSGLIPVGEGLWRDVNTGNLIDENGYVYNQHGELVSSSYEDDCRE